MSAPPQKPLTIRDLARLSGLSKSTISNALRDNGRVTSATRDQIITLARKVGYVPNTLAAALASSKKSQAVHSLRIAFVTHFPPHYSNNSFLFTQNRLRELGYESDWFDLPRENLSPTSLRNRIYHRGFSGVILSEIRTDHTQLFGQDWSSFSVVCGRRTHYRPPFDLVRSNSFAAVSLAWDRIRSAGYSRIGFMLCRHSPRMLDDLEREGALGVLQQELTGDESAVPPYVGKTEDKSAIMQWFRRHKPDAVVGFFAFHADVLREAGLRIPHDIAFASLHSDDAPPKMACIDPGDRHVPLICADYIDHMIRQKRLGAPAHPREILAPVSWIPGETLPQKKR